MELCVQLYIRKIVNTIINNLKQNHSTLLFVKHYNTLNIPFKEIQNSVSVSETNVILLYHEFSLNDVQEAYCPFLYWIKDIYNKYYKSKIPVETFVEQAGVYSQTRSVICSYIETGVCKRDEDIILTEANYEKQMLLNSLCNILKFISKEHTLFIVLNRLHFAEQSTLMLLNEFLKHQISNISLLANYNEVYAVPPYAHNEWVKLINEAEAQNLLLDWNIQSSQQENSSEINIFEPTKAHLETYLIKINNMVLMLAIDQAIYYLDVIYHKIIAEKNTPSKLINRFYELYAYASIYLDHTTTALMMCEKLKNAFGSRAGKREYFRYYYILCLIQLCSDQYALAEKTALDLKTIAEDTGIDELLFRAELMGLVVRLKGFKSILRLDSYIEDDEYAELAQKTLDRKFYNHMAYIYILGYCNQRRFYCDNDDERETPTMFLRGVELAEKLGNKNLLFTAWQKNVMMAQAYGYFSHVDYYYKKCLEIIANENNKLQEAAIYNGIGFSRIVTEQPQQANEYFNKALEIYMQQNDNYYIAETLYNKATNAILAEEYEDAYELLLLTLKILKAVKINRMNVCNISKIYGFLVLCSYRMGIDYSANFYLTQMGLILRHILKPDGEPSYFLWDDDMFLYYFTSGLLAKSDDVELAQTYFDKARFHMMRSDGFLFVSYHQFAMEQAELYEMQNKPGLAKEILEQSIEFCNKHGYKHKEETLFAKMYHQPLLHKRIHLNISPEIRRQIENIYKIKSMEIELAEKNQGLNFLVAWQELLNRDGIRIEQFIEDSMTTIQNNYNVDRILYVDMQNGKPVIMYKSSDFEVTDDMIQSITKYFNKHRKEFIASRFEKSFYDYSDLLSLFGLNNVLSVACVPMTTNEKLDCYMIALADLKDNMTNDINFLEQSDLTIFKFALKQMTDAIYRLKTRMEISRMNQKLQKSAVTDFLTGLLNRNGFSKNISDYEREKAAKKLPDIPFVVLYIDLDNFKYCNDTFGHDAGDIILKSFADMFQEAAKPDGYCVRYGGDEFVIVLPGSTAREGIETAKSIYRQIEESEHFIPQIEAHLNKTVNVPPETRVSCSIGIADSEVYDNDHMTITLKHADSVLYDIKKNTKRNYRVYKEPSEAIDK